MQFSLSKRSAAMALASLLAVGAASAMPWGDKGPGGDRSEMRMQRMTAELNLSAEQQAKMKALHDAKRQQMQANMAQRKKLHEEQRTAMSAPTLDAAKLESLRQQEVRMHDEMSKARLEHQVAMAQILTPEQRQKMAAKMGERGSKGMHRGFGHGPVGNPSGN